MKKKLNIGIQGIVGSFHHQAALTYFKENEIALCIFHSFSDMAEALEKKEIDISLMAIENTIVGAILPNYMLIKKHKLFIVGEVYESINHNLMVIPGVKIEDLKKIESHPMALLQCQNFFAKHPSISCVPANDTAWAAAQIIERKQKHIGAIAPMQAAKTYGLEIIAENIQDTKHNYTRFLVLENQSTVKKIETFNKISVCFYLKHKKGALTQVLEKIQTYDANLTKIQSLPVVTQSWHYIFFVDFVLGHKDPNTWNNLFNMLKTETQKLLLLGTYKNTWL